MLFGTRLEFFFSALPHYSWPISTLALIKALTVSGIPRWQSQFHSHAGTLGWVTLSVIAFAIWHSTAERQVTDDYFRSVNNLTRYGIWIFGGYIVAFRLAFAGLGQIFFMNMPIFELAATIYIWTAAVFSASQ